MIFHRHNYEDIKRYYSHTIIKLPNVSGDRLWQIVSINMDEVKMVDVDGMEVYIDLNEEYEVEHPLPGRVVYQTNDGRAALLSRKPAKQYYRGLHKDNTQLMYYSAGGGLHNLGWSIATLQEFVDKPCYQNPNSLNLEDGYSSWALTPYMALTADGLIMVLNSPVAITSIADKKITMTRPLFKKEVKAAFPSWSVE